MVSKAEREELARVFKKLDLNGDGRLSKDEIKDGYAKHFGRLISDKEVDFMFNAVDTDQSGYIDYTEFVVAAMNEKLLLSNERLMAAFKMFDKDGSGSITPDEIKKVLFSAENKIPNSVIESVIKQPAVATSTGAPRASDIASRALASVKSDGASLKSRRQSTSDESSAEPRATDPNTRIRTTPRFSRVARIGARRMRTSSIVMEAGW